MKKYWVIIVILVVLLMILSGLAYYLTKKGNAKYQDINVDSNNSSNINYLGTVSKIDGQYITINNDENLKCKLQEGINIVKSEENYSSVLNLGDLKEGDILMGECGKDKNFIWIQYLNGNINNEK